MQKKFLFLRNNFVPIAIFLLLFLIATRKFLFAPGFILYSELPNSTNFHFLFLEQLKPWSDYTSLGNSNIGYPVIYGRNPQFSVIPNNAAIIFTGTMAFLELLFKTNSLKVFFFLALLFQFFGMYNLTKFWYSSFGKSKNFLNLMSITSAVIFIVNMETVGKIIAGAFFYVYAYTLFPWFFFFKLKYLEENNNKLFSKNLILSSILFAVAVSLMPHLLVMVIILLILYLFFLIPLSKKVFLRLFILSCTMIITFLIFNFYLFLPSLFFSENYPIIKDVLFNYESLFYTSGQNRALNILLFKSPEQTGSHNAVLTYILIIAAMIGAFFQKNLRKTFYLLSLATLGIILASTLNNFSKGFFLWLYNNIFIFRIFRETNKFTFLYMISFSLLLPGSFIFIRKYLKKFFKLSVILIILISLYVNSAFLSGNFSQSFIPFKIPQKYFALNKFLAKQNSDFRVMIVPNDLTLSDYNWIAKTKIAPTAFNPFFNLIPLNKYIANSNRTVNDFNSRYLDFLETNLYTDWAIEKLAAINVKYIIVDTSIKNFENYLKYLRKNPLLTEEKKLKEFYLFEIKNYHASYLYKKKAVYYFGDLKGIKFLPKDLGLINLALNPINILDRNYSREIYLYNSDLKNLFLNTQKKYLFSFLPEVRYVRSPLEGFILSNEYIRSFLKEGINFYSQQGLYTSKSTQISKKTNLLSGNYKTFVSRLNTPNQSKQIGISFNGTKLKKISPSGNTQGLVWDEFNEVEVKNNQPTLTLENLENKPLFIDSILVFPASDYQKNYKNFLAKIRNKKIIYFGDEAKPTLTIEQQRKITILSKTFSPYWDLCGNEIFVVDYYFIGSDCQNGARIKPYFKASGIYYFSLALSAVFLLASIIYFTHV